MKLSINYQSTEKVFDQLEIGDVFLVYNGNMMIKTELLAKGNHTTNCLYLTGASSGKVAHLEDDQLVNIPPKNLLVTLA
jgi:hypothetical protein